MTCRVTVEPDDPKDAYALGGNWSSVTGGTRTWLGYDDIWLTRSFDERDFDLYRSTPIGCKARITVQAYDRDRQPIPNATMVYHGALICVGLPDIGTSSRVPALTTVEFRVLSVE